MQSLSCRLLLTPIRIFQLLAEFPCANSRVTSWTSSLPLIRLVLFCLVWHILFFLRGSLTHSCSDFIISFFSIFFPLPLFILFPNCIYCMNCELISIYIYIACLMLYYPSPVKISRMCDVYHSFTLFVWSCPGIAVDEESLHQFDESWFWGPCKWQKLHCYSVFFPQSELLLSPSGFRIIALLSNICCKIPLLDFIICLNVVL